ncbi:hypothetical protein [Pedobacter sp.]
MRFKREDLVSTAEFLVEVKIDGYEFVSYPRDRDMYTGNEIYAFVQRRSADEHAKVNGDWYVEPLAPFLKTMIQTLNENKTAQIVETGHYYHLNNQKNMNENNLAFLKNKLEKMDFPVSVLDKLEKEINVKDQKSDVNIAHEMTRGNDVVKYDLQFRKSDTSDMYFFNNYKATLDTGNAATDKSQDFRIRNGNNIGADEAFNLVAGRAVQKSMVNGDGDNYLAWLKIDFSQKDNYGNNKVEQFHDRYGYNLEKALDRFPIAELAKPEEKADLVASLKAGNSTAVTMVKDGKEAVLFIEANPRLRTINIKDEKGASVRRDQLEIKDTSKSKAVAENQGQEKGQNSRKRQGLSV